MHVLCAVENSSAVTRILERNPNASWTHCNLHRTALVSKYIYDDFKNVLKTSVKIMNFINSKPLQSRLFEKLCEVMGRNHKSLLLHTEIRWLSRGKVLTRLAELREEVAMFLEGKCNFLARRRIYSKAYVFGRYFFEIK